MGRNFVIALVIVGVVGAGGAIATSPASALTISELQAQVQELVAQIRVLGGQPAFTQIQNPVAADAFNPAGNLRHRICSVLYRNLSQGAQGEDVVSLQEYLRAEGHLSANATGYFGPLTHAAVARWQASQGVSAAGSFGPLSRERIRIWCGGGGVPLSGLLQASPTRGSAPLTVQFTTTGTRELPPTNVAVPTDGPVLSVDFGDGTVERMSTERRCATTDTAQGMCMLIPSISHTYTSNGTFNARLLSLNLGGERVIGTVTIHVGPQNCTKEYMPVCGSKPIVCITTPCNPIQQTYGNRCEMNADGATFLYEGACRDTSTDPANDPRCKAWYDGCNTCSRQTPGGPAMCTLRACYGGGDVMNSSGATTPGGTAVTTGTVQSSSVMPMRKIPYCTAWFENASGNKPPVISEFSGPTTLSIDQTGTWTIRASDPENGELRYNLTWGDEELNRATSNQSAVDGMPYFTDTTFTHTYSTAGTYTVTIVVRDSAGLEARTTSTVRVGTQCPSLAPYMPCPQGTTHEWTYDSNGCKISVKCISSPVSCTADARQCPDGSYVGRTGPKCEFVCPVSDQSYGGSQCKKWSDGKWCGQRCSRSAPGGSVTCDMMTCMAIGPSNPVPSCLEYF